MSIRAAETHATASGARKRVIYQSEALFAGGNYLQRIQSINYSFTVPRTDVNQYGQLGQIERVITEVPTVSMDFGYHMAGTTNETLLLGAGSNGASAGFMKDLNRSDSNQYEQTFAIALANEGVDYLNDQNHTNQSIIIPKGHISSYNWNGAVGDVPNATVNVESTEMKVGAGGSNQNSQSPESSAAPVVLRPGNVTFASQAHTDIGLASTTPEDVPIMGFNNVHVQSFTVAVDIPRESIQRMGDRYEYARVITFPIQATMSVEAIISNQAESNLSDIVGDQDVAAPDPGFDIDINCGKSGSTPAGVNGIKLRFKNAKIEGHSVSSSIGSNKSVTLDYAVQVDAGGYGYASSSVSAGFFMQAI